MADHEPAGASPQASSRDGTSPSGRGSRRLVLASGSPQRKAILGGLGLDFEVRQTDVAEEEAGAPHAVARENALRKALAAAAQTKDSDDELIVGCDTLVATEQDIWGKPADEDAARATLRHLAGRTHLVVSGLALVRAGEVRTATEVTEVTFRHLDDEAIAWYVSCGEWQGRAGGYAIQGRGGALVRRIAGDYLNVVGLPVAALLDLEPHLLDHHAAA